MGQTVPTIQASIAFLPSQNGKKRQINNTLRGITPNQLIKNSEFRGISSFLARTQGCCSKEIILSSF
jgi:hypothetical protein